MKLNLSSRMKIIVGLFAGVSTVLLCLIVFVIYMERNFGEDPLNQGLENDGVSAYIAAYHYGKFKAFIQIRNRNAYPVSVDIKARVSEKESEHVHVNLEAGHSDTIHHPETKESYLEVLSLTVYKL